MKFQHILFPIDFSDSSRALAREVEYLASRFQSEVTLLHVMEIPSTWYGSGEAPLMNADCILQLVEQKREALNNFSINVPKERLHRAVAEGDPAWQIKDYAREHNVDLIVMGTHGYNTMRRLLLGSVAMKVLHDVSCPVWTHSPAKSMNGRVKTGVKKIVCALELNGETVPLLRFASNVATELGASVRLIHSIPDDSSRPYRYFDTDFHFWAAL